MIEVYDELLREHILVAHKEFHEGRYKLSLFSVPLLEIKDNWLQEVLDTNFSILLNQVEKGLLVGFPILHYVVLFAGVEASTEENPVAEFWGKALRGSDELELIQDTVNLARVFKYECMQFRDCIFY